MSALSSETGIRYDRSLKLPAGTAVGFTLAAPRPAPYNKTNPPLGGAGNPAERPRQTGGDPLNLIRLVPA